MKMEKSLSEPGTRIKNMEKGNLLMQIMMYTLGNFRTTKRRGMEPSYMQIMKNMKEIGVIIREMAMGNTTLKMGQFTKGNLKMTKLLESENLPCKVEMYSSVLF